MEPGKRTAVLDGTALAMLLDGIDLARVKRPTLWEPPSAVASRKLPHVLWVHCLLCPTNP
jgi:hypothetical protein